MKKCMEILKAARWLELLLVSAALAVAALLFMGGENASNPANASPDELRMQRILSEIEGTGKVSVMISEDPENADAPTGVVVAASGAADIQVLLKIQNAVRTLTGLPAGKIEVYASG